MEEELAIKTIDNSRLLEPPLTLWKSAYAIAIATAPKPKLIPKLILKYPFMKLNKRAKIILKKIDLKLTPPMIN